jgi:hypothetical protein
LLRTKDAHVRIEPVSWRPDASVDGVLWPLILPLAFGDRITIDELPTTAPSTSMDMIVGRVAHSGGAGTWMTTLTLEPAVIDQMGVCDDPVYGVADTPLCVAGY